MTEIDLTAIEAERDRIRTVHLRPTAERPGSSARGVHHVALLCANVERTVRFYQDVLELPLTEIFENRDYKGSNHFFFDVGNGNLLAFFDLARARPRAVCRGAGWAAPPGHLRRAGTVVAAQGEPRSGRRGLPGGERHLGVLPRPRWRTPGAHLRSPRADVWNGGSLNEAFCPGDTRPAPAGHPTVIFRSMPLSLWPGTEHDSS